MTILFWTISISVITIVFFIGVVVGSKGEREVIINTLEEKGKFYIPGTSKVVILIDRINDKDSK